MLFNRWVLQIVRKCMLDPTKGCLYDPARYTWTCV